MVLGILAGIVALGGLGALTIYGTTASVPVLSFIAPWLLPGYFLAALWLALTKKTTRFGAGLLIAIGAWFVIGAGVCFAMVAGVGR
jgi:hypothetical protein